MVAIEASANRLEGLARIAPGQIHSDLPGLDDTPFARSGQELLHGKLAMLAHKFLNMLDRDLLSASYYVSHDTSSKFGVYG